MVAKVKAQYHEIFQWENLYAAYRKAAKGKRGKGPAAAFEFELEDNLVTLQSELQTGDYRPGDYRSFFIHEPKRRLISAAPFRDRVVHHALCAVIEPAFERSFIYHSYANRLGKGTHRALDTCQKWMRQFKYVLQCDVRQFFPSIDHQIMRKILNRRIVDEGTRRLIGHILESGKNVLKREYRMVYFPGDELFANNRDRGLPIGNLTSQFWANCYLNGFDHYVNRQLRCGHYLRYVDDFLLFSNDKKQLRHWLGKIIKRLACFRLTIHEKEAQVRPTKEGIRFLGFVVYPGHRLLLRRKGIAFQRRLRNLMANYQNGVVAKDDVRASLLGWINHVRYADTWGLRRNVLSHVKL